MTDARQSTSFPGVQQLAEQIFENIERAYAGPQAELSHAVLEAHLQSLSFLFDKNLSRAFDILEKGGVICFVGEQSRRVVFQCKHQLAARMAQALRRCKITELPDHLLAEVMLMP